MLKDKKLLYLIKTMDLGGAEKFTLNLAKYFKEYFKSVTIVSSGGIYEESLKQNNIDHYTIREELKISNVISLSKELNSFVKENGFDLIHTHHRLLQFTLQFSSRRSYKNIYTSHNIFNDIYQKTLFPDAAVGISATMYDGLIKSLPINKNNIHLINYGIECTEKKIVPLKQTPPRFGYSGRLLEVKGIFILLKAIKRLKLDGYQFSFVFRGKGEEDKLKNLILDYAIEDIVKIFPPSTTNDEIYSDFDILILPTKYNEGLPISILEAAAHGKLIIASKAGGITDFVENNITGVLLESITEDEVYEKMKSIIMGRVNTEDILSKALDKVQKYFSLDSSCMKYKQLYNNILSDHA